MKNTKEWFASWFNSPYYNVLYQHRDFQEAEQFILRLLERLSPAAQSEFLDLACGRGRHAYFVNKQGYTVTGLDLSAERITEAQSFANDHLTFQVHDMRDPLPGTYDFVLNLFTSFGYFDHQNDNLVVLQNVRKALRPGGMLVLDFLNVGQVVAQLVPEERKQIGDIEVAIHRRLEKGFIVKDIEVVDQGQSHHFQERVQGITRADFGKMFNVAGLEVVDVWGDYAGNAWDEQRSPRLIFFCAVSPTP